MALQLPITPGQRGADIRARVGEFTDKLGREMDPGILETVVTLNVAGFATVQSCEGHLDHGTPYPWVNLADVGWERIIEKDWVRVAALRDLAKERADLTNCNRYLAADIEYRLQIDRYTQQNDFYQALHDLLEAFYANNAPTPYRLYVTRFKTPGRYRLEPGLAKSLEDIPVSLRERYLHQTQAEMVAFTAYLKQQIV